ncbi:TPT-domain-containing protein [Rozella allomycis CSF55]|uniref:TPT-domain-containing protein n=1 Tax=Rozella allomycis (strain CSF55) TaxID=988480 RepID=A0A4P9YQ81_ROZAC|nr:TPT-domain-containing protein [Rozella allomycis CSF55]
MRPSFRFLHKHKKSFQILAYCLAWYAASALTNNINKVILSEYPYPVVLTWAQFLFTSLSSFALLKATCAKITAFQWNMALSFIPLCFLMILGHVLTSVSLSFMGVSMVHTIKGLAPLFTVTISVLFKGHKYSNDVYKALVPLTLGVLLTCYSETAFHKIGVLAAMSSTVVFSIKDLFSKQIISHFHKQMGKLLYMFYASLFSMSLLTIYQLFYPFQTSSDKGTLVFSINLEHKMTFFVFTLFIFDGLSHFMQSYFAVSVLALVSAVAYSIASLGKRLIVISSSILFFGDQISFVKVFGISLSFWGIFLYNNAKNDRSRILPL